MIKTDVVIIGSGVAALQLAGKLRSDLNVIIITKSDIKHGNSHKAQGGIAASLGIEDDYYQHYLDTLEAGRNYNDEEAVLQLTKDAPSLIEDLIAKGCQFDFGPDGRPLLGREGSHSTNRIVHGGGDQTGKRIVECLVEALPKRLTVMENTFVYELLVTDEQCNGVKVKDKDGNNQTIIANHTVLATGGCGQVYSITSNADTVTGDGIALAYRAGAEITDMEFVQFHPTLLMINGEGKGLVSEAVRGEGARLRTEDGTPIMDGVHPLKDLAPRHIVSQTIYDYIQQGESVFLDIRMIDDFNKRFPTVSALCEENNIDLTKGRIPVAPGSHFLMGGVKTDLDGRTSMEGLYAIGEVACTGIHGANRLASNSLLEGLAYGQRAAFSINKSTRLARDVLYPNLTNQTISPAIQLPDLAELQERMMKNTGIVRDKEQLQKHIDWLEDYHTSKLISMNYDSLTKEEINMIFMVISSWLISTSALERTESRGGHFRQDYPFEDDRWLKKQIVHRRQFEKDEIYEQVKAAATS